LESIQIKDPCVTVAVSSSNFLATLVPGHVFAEFEHARDLMQRGEDTHAISATMGHPISFIRTIERHAENGEFLSSI
jgi:hypothetical protein